MSDFDVGDDAGSGAGAAASGGVASDPWGTNLSAAVAGGVYTAGTAGYLLWQLTQARRSIVCAVSPVINPIAITQGATEPPIVFPTLTDQNDAPISIAAAQMIMATGPGTAPILTGACVVDGPGNVTFRWGPSDTSMPGRYEFIVRITDTSGGTWIFPQGACWVVNVIPCLGS